jgi:hypothetical protein
VVASNYFATGFLQSDALSDALSFDWIHLYDGQCDWSKIPTAKVATEKPGRRKVPAVLQRLRGFQGS